MTDLRVVLADDEAPARRALLRALAVHEDVVVVGEAETGLQALALVRSHQPDLLFLDIRMPGMDGLDVSEALRGEPGPAVVFVTAFGEYAVNAFEQAALDYLLKPVDPERVAESLRRFRESGAPRMGEISPALESPASDHALLRMGGSLRAVNRDSVTHLEAAGNYVRVHTDSGTLLVRGSLPHLIETLDVGLHRVHRSFALRPDQVLEIRRPDGNDSTASLACGAEVPIGRTYWKDVVTWFKT